jgi:hypothetical protein
MPLNYRLWQLLHHRHAVQSRFQCGHRIVSSLLLISLDAATQCTTPSSLVEVISYLHLMAKTLIWYISILVIAVRTKANKLTQQSNSK